MVRGEDEVIFRLLKDAIFEIRWTFRHQTREEAISTVILIIQPGAQKRILSFSLVWRIDHLCYCRSWSPTWGNCWRKFWFQFTLEAPFKWDDLSNRILKCRSNPKRCPSRTTCHAGKYVSKKGGTEISQSSECWFNSKSIVVELTYWWCLPPQFLSQWRYWITLTCFRRLVGPRTQASTEGTLSWW